ncbi:MAG TPA: hypothetical protein VHC46_06605 [Thermodesulfobacteriota bacterium]|nr:hypothetical protein [Thermodesulfobacteriota bacterium]
MAEEFDNDIREIARSVQKSTNIAPPALTDTDKAFLAAIEDLYVHFRRAITIFNEASPGMRLSLQRLTPDFLDLFLTIPGRRGGFSVFSPSRIIILFDEDPNVLTVIGKKRITEKDGGGKLSPAIQLIKVNFKKEDNTIAYKDNAGGPVELHGLVTLIIKWVSAA